MRITRKKLHLNIYIYIYKRWNGIQTERLWNSFSRLQEAKFCGWCIPRSTTNKLTITSLKFTYQVEARGRSASSPEPWDRERCSFPDALRFTWPFILGPTDRKRNQCFWFWFYLFAPKARKVHGQKKKTKGEKRREGGPK